ncbi:MAG: hypothetical protein H0X37_18150 [Herpetosiphonaceae bacterium]|nr:hypothetical protein [Herpetosiphonaceae bacterium]
MYDAADTANALTPADLRELPGWLAEAYPQLLAHPRLTARLEVYEALWQLVQVFHFGRGSGVHDPWAHLRVLLDSTNSWARLG